MSLDLFQKRKYLVHGFSKNECDKVSVLPLVILQLIICYLENIYEWKLPIAYLMTGNEYDCKVYQTFTYQKKQQCQSSNDDNKFIIGINKEWLFMSFYSGPIHQWKKFIIEVFWKEKQLHGERTFTVEDWTLFTYFSSIKKTYGSEIFTDFTDINLQFKVYAKTENE